MRNKIALTILLALLLTVHSIVFAEEPVLVETAVVKKGVITQYRKINGVVEALQNITISAKNGGVVNRVEVEVGQKVKAGDILVVFDKEELLARVKQAEAALELAKANLQQLLKGPEEEQIDLVKASYEQAMASFEGAKKSLELASSMYEDKNPQKAAACFGRNPA